jgi:glycosyltransferase involved in cell wall biosynthesis
MRLIYLHQYFNTPEMMGGTRSFEIGRRLVAAGHTVEVITSWRERSSRRGWFTTETQGMRVHWLPVHYSNHMGYGARMAAFARFAVAAASRANSLEADAIFATSTPLTIALPAVYAARRKRIPMIFEVRDLWPDLPIAVGAIRSPMARWLARKLETFAYSNAARVIALSPGMAAGVARRGYAPERITVVPNGADLELFEPGGSRGREFRRRLGIADDSIVIGYAGTFGRINGVAYLVRVAAAMRSEPRAVFVLIGEGHDRAEVERLARELGVLNRNLLLLPGVAKSDMPAVLSGLDIATSLFLPIREMETNSANKFFDGLAAGCCVAINYGGWQADILASNQAGIRLATDPAEAAVQLTALVREPDRIRSCRCNARSLAVAQFSRDDLARRVEAIISEVASNSRNAGGR